MLETDHGPAPTVRELLSCVNVEVAHALQHGRGQKAALLLERPDQAEDPAGVTVGAAPRSQKRAGLRARGRSPSPRRDGREPPLPCYNDHSARARELPRTNARCRSSPSTPRRPSRCDANNLKPVAGGSTAEAALPRPPSELFKVQKAKTALRHAEVRHLAAKHRPIRPKYEPIASPNADLEPGMELDPILAEMTGVYPLIDRGLCYNGDFTPYLVQWPSLRTALPPLRQSPLPLHDRREQFVPYNKEQNPKGICYSTLKLDLPESANGTAAQRAEAPDRTCATFRRTEKQREVPDRPATPANSRTKPDEYAAAREREIAVAASEETSGFGLELIVAEGKLNVTSPAFEAFREFLEGSDWGAAVVILQRLQSLSREYSIPWMQISCDKVAALASQVLLDVATDSQLMDCIINSGEVASIRKLPGQRFRGTDGMHAAATRIASIWRMLKHRRLHQTLKRQKRAVNAIAVRRRQVIIGRQMMSESKAAAIRSLQECDELAKTLPAMWGRLFKGPRTVIHLPSLSTSFIARAAAGDVHPHQHFQIERLVDLLDPDVTVIYITPYHIDSPTQSLIGSLLGSSAAKNYEARLKTVVPELARLFKPSASLTSMLLASHRAMQRVKTLISGQNACIIPGLPGRDDYLLARALNVPLITAGPSTLRECSTRGGAVQLLREAGLPVPESIHIAPFRRPTEKSRKAGARIFVDFVRRHLAIRRWLFKANDHFGSRGIAYLDTQKTQLYKMLRPKKTGASKKDDKHAQGRGRYSDEQLASQALEDLDAHAVLCDTSSYGSWKEFYANFLVLGGLVEASLDSPPSNATTLTALMWIDGDGSAKMFGSKEQINVQPYVNWGAISPQTRVPHVDLLTPALKVAKACYDRGIVGYVEADFLLRDSGTENALDAVSLKIGFSPSAVHSIVSQLATGSPLDPESGLVRYDVNKSRRMQLHYLSKVKNIDKARLRQAINAAETDPVNLQERVSLSSDMIWHTNFGCFKPGTFLGLCRTENIVFNEKLKVGMLVLSSYAQKNTVYLRLRCLQPSTEDAVRLFVFHLSLIQRLSTTSSLGGESNFLPAAMFLKRYLSGIHAQAPPKPGPGFALSARARSRRNAVADLKKVTRSSKTVDVAGAVDDPAEQTLEGLLEDIGAADLANQQSVPEWRIAAEDVRKMAVAEAKKHAEEKERSWATVKVVTLRDIQRNYEESKAPTSAETKS